MMQVNLWAYQKKWSKRPEYESEEIINNLSKLFTLFCDIFSDKNQGFTD